MSKKSMLKSFMLTTLTFSSSLCLAIPPSEEKERDFTELFPTHLSVKIFSNGTPEDASRLAGVSKRWQKQLDTPALWNFFAQPFQGDYPPETWQLGGKSKETFINHRLKMEMNQLNTPEAISAFIDRFPCLLTAPQVCFGQTMDALYLNQSVLTLCREKSSAIAIAQEEVKTVEQISSDSPLVVSSPVPNLSQETLREQEEEKAIKQTPSDSSLVVSSSPASNLPDVAQEEVVDLGLKIQGLTDGIYGYKKNRAAARKYNNALAAQGDKEAITRKLDGLAYGRYGYKKNLTAARAFNEKLIAQGDREALHRKIEALEERDYGYKRNRTDARKLNDTLVDQNDKEAIFRKAEGLMFGAYGYKENRIAGRELNETLVTQNDVNAIVLKIEGLVCGKWGYEKNYAIAQELYKIMIEQNNENILEEKDGLFYTIADANPAAVREVNEELVAQGEEEAFERKINGLYNGWSGYEKDPGEALKFNEALVKQGFKAAIERRESLFYYTDPVAAREINEELVAQGDEEAFERKINGLYNGSSGYEKDPDEALKFNETLVKLGNKKAIERRELLFYVAPVAAREINEELVAQGDEEAIQQKVDGLVYGYRGSGYEKDLAAALKFNETLAKQGNKKAMERRTSLFSSAVYQDPNAAREFNEDLTRQGDEEAIQRKIEGLYNGLSGYEKDSAAAVQFNDELAEKGNEKALIRQIEGLNSGWRYGYPLDRARARSIIENRLMKNEKTRRLGQYLKAFGLKEGNFGFDKNEEEANKDIQEHSIAY
jgi:hypothetical protein